MSDPILITSILLVGLVFKFIGFAVRDELWLRILVASGLACDVLFYGLRPEPVLQSVVANILLVSINVTLILLIVAERTTWRMSAADRALYAQFPTLTPGQFRRIAKMMRHETMEPGAELAQEGQSVDALMLVFAARIEIEKQGAAFPIAGPAFIGEIAFLTGQASSAGVRLPKGGTVVSLPIADLKKRMTRSPPLSNAMVALFGQELARKVADSIPMDRAARPRGAAPGILPPPAGADAADASSGLK